MFVEIDPAAAYKAGQARECLAAAHEGIWISGKDGVTRWCGRSAEAEDLDQIKTEDGAAGRAYRDGVAAAANLLFGSGPILDRMTQFRDAHRRRT